MTRVQTVLVGVVLNAILAGFLLLNQRPAPTPPVDHPPCPHPLPNPEPGSTNSSGGGGKAETTGSPPPAPSPPPPAPASPPQPPPAPTEPPKTRTAQAQSSNGSLHSFPEELPMRNWTLQPVFGQNWTTAGSPWSEEFFTFQSVGDWGLNNKIKTATVEGMAYYSEKIGNTQFFISMGDNFYTRGVRSVEDPKFRLVFEEQFAAPAFFRPWYIILGNHDKLGNETAQLAYSHLPGQKRWRMPAKYYHAVSKLGGVRIDFFFLDNILNPPAKDMHYAQRQMIWLRKGLTRAAARGGWRVVVNHGPFYTATVRPVWKSRVVQRKLVMRLLKSAGADLYICGHHHALEVSRESPTSRLTMVTAGSASGIYPLRPLKSHPEQVVFAREIPGFLALHASLSMLRTEIRDWKGRLLYQVDLARGTGQGVTLWPVDAPPIHPSDECQGADPRASGSLAYDGIRSSCTSSGYPGEDSVFDRQRD